MIRKTNSLWTIPLNSAQDHLLSHSLSSQALRKRSTCLKFSKSTSHFIHNTSYTVLFNLNIHRKPTGLIMLTLVYISTQVSKIRLSVCSSTCSGSGKTEGSFFAFMHKGAMLPRCQLQSNVEATTCYQPRCFPNEVCATSVSEHTG